MKAVVGIFQNRTEAEQALNALLEAGFARDELNLVLRDSQAAQGVTAEPKAESRHSSNQETAIGAAIGASSGATVGGFAGLLLSVGLVVVPGIGPVIAAGTLASALTAVAVGAGVGAAAGGLAGGLIGFGLPEGAARQYAAGVERGDILMVVHTGAGRDENAAELMRQMGAREVSAHPFDALSEELG